MAIVQRPDPDVTAGTPAANEIGEATISADAQAPDPRSLVAMVRAHQSMVWRYLRLLGADPHEADDLMQDAFVRLAGAMHRGEPLHAPAAFLRGIARNLLIGTRRRARCRTPTVEWADAVDQFASRPAALEDDRIEALRRCVSRLTGRVRQAVEWHHVEGLSCRETAQRIGIGVQGIKSLLGRAREALRQCIEQQLRGDQTS